MNSRFGGGFRVRHASQRERFMFIAAAGLVFSLLVILLVVFNYRSTASASKTQLQSPTSEFQTAMGTVTLYASNQFVRAGAQLSDFQFKDVYWPRNAVPVGAVRNLAELRGMYAKVDIPNGVPIQRSHLTREKRVFTLPITAGMRAVTIEINSQSGIEGWAQPGTRVDIVLTYLNENELTSKVIVQNVRVLSYGGDATLASEKSGIMSKQNKVKPGSTITLEATPSDALKIQTSRQLGTLSLLMRAPEDDRTPDVVEVDQNAIDGSASSRANKQNRTCSKGIMRMSGQEYIIDCDGSISQVTGSRYEP